MGYRARKVRLYKELLQELCEKLRKRNKLIRIGSSTQSTFPGVQLFRGPYGTPPLFPAFGLGTGPCFACGEYNHIRKQCPHVNRGAGAVKVQLTSKAE